MGDEGKGLWGAEGGCPPAQVGELASGGLRRSIGLVMSGSLEWEWDVDGIKNGGSLKLFGRVVTFLTSTDWEAKGSFRPGTERLCTPLFKFFAGEGAGFAFKLRLMKWFL